MSEQGDRRSCPGMMLVETQQRREHASIVTGTGGPWIDPRAQPAEAMLREHRGGEGPNDGEPA